MKLYFLWIYWCTCLFLFFLPEVRTFSFSSIWNPRIWTHVVALCYTHLRHWGKDRGKTLKRFWQNQYIYRHILQTSGRTMFTCLTVLTKERSTGTYKNVASVSEISYSATNMLIIRKNKCYPCPRFLNCVNGCKTGKSSVTRGQVNIVSWENPDWAGWVKVLLGPLSVTPAHWPDSRSVATWERISNKGEKSYVNRLMLILSDNCLINRRTTVLKSQGN